MKKDLLLRIGNLYLWVERMERDKLGLLLFKDGHYIGRLFKSQWTITGRDGYGYILEEKR